MKELKRTKLTKRKVDLGGSPKPKAVSPPAELDVPGALPKPQPPQVLVPEPLPVEELPEPPTLKPGSGGVLPGDKVTPDVAGTRSKSESVPVTGSEDGFGGTTPTRRPLVPPPPMESEPTLAPQPLPVEESPEPAETLMMDEPPPMESEPVPEPATEEPAPQQEEPEPAPATEPLEKPPEMDIDLDDLGFPEGATPSDIPSLSGVGLSDEDVVEGSDPDAIPLSDEEQPEPHVTPPPPPLDEEPEPLQPEPAETLMMDEPPEMEPEPQPVLEPDTALDAQPPVQDDEQAAGMPITPDVGDKCKTILAEDAPQKQGESIEYFGLRITLTTIGKNYPDGNIQRIFVYTLLDIDSGDSEEVTFNRDSGHSTGKGHDIGRYVQFSKDGTIWILAKGEDPNTFSFPDVRIDDADVISAHTDPNATPLVSADDLASAAEDPGVTQFSSDAPKVWIDSFVTDLNKWSTQPLSEDDFEVHVESVVRALASEADETQLFDHITSITTAVEGNVSVIPQQVKNEIARFLSAEMLQREIDKLESPEEDVRRAACDSLNQMIPRKNMLTPGLAGLPQKLTLYSTVVDFADAELIKASEVLTASLLLAKAENSTIPDIEDPVKDLVSVVYGAHSVDNPSHTKIISKPTPRQDTSLALEIVGPGGVVVKSHVFEQDQVVIGGGGMILLDDLPVRSSVIMNYDSVVNETGKAHAVLEVESGRVLLKPQDGQVTVTKQDGTFESHEPHATPSELQEDDLIRIGSSDVRLGVLAITPRTDAVRQTMFAPHVAPQPDDSGVAGVIGDEPVAAPLPEPLAAPPESSEVLGDVAVDDPASGVNAEGWGSIKAQEHPLSTFTGTDNRLNKRRLNLVAGPHADNADEIEYSVRFHGIWGLGKPIQTEKLTVRKGGDLVTLEGSEERIHALWREGQDNPVVKIVPKARTAFTPKIDVSLSAPKRKTNWGKWLLIPLGVGIVGTGVTAAIMLAQLDGKKPQPKKASPPAKVVASPPKVVKPQPPVLPEVGGVTTEPKAPPREVPKPKPRPKVKVREAPAPVQRPKTRKRSRTKRPPVVQRPRVVKPRISHVALPFSKLPGSGKVKRTLRRELRDAEANNVTIILQLRYRAGAWSMRVVRSNAKTNADAVRRALKSSKYFSWTPVLGSTAELDKNTIYSAKLTLFGSSTSPIKF